jgi:glycosyltransferase involved in cell wall biosynthesis
MRIFLDARLALTNTGTGRVTYNLFKEVLIQDKKNDYTILYDKKDPFPEIKCGKIRIRDKDSRLSYLWQLFILPKILNKHHAEIFLSIENMVCPLTFKGNLIVSIQDLIPLVIKDYYNRLNDKIRYKIQIATFLIKAKNSKVITVSEFSKEEIIKYLHIPKDKIHVIENAYTKDNMEINTDQILKNLNINFPYILAIGGAEKRKNNKTLIQAYKMLNIREHLVIVGNVKRGKEASQFEDLPQGEKIHFVGKISNEEVLSLYTKASIFVYISCYEGFGLPVLEAFAQNIPTIVSNTTSIPEVAGKGAILVDPFNQKQIASGIEKLLTDQEAREQIIKLAKEQLKKYSWRKSALKLINLFNTLNI